MGVRVNLHVELAKEELTEIDETGIDEFGGHQALDQVIGKRGSRLVVL